MAGLGSSTAIFLLSVGQPWTKTDTAFCHICRLWSPAGALGSATSFSLCVMIPIDSGSLPGNHVVAAELRDLPIWNPRANCFGSLPGQKEHTHTLCLSPVSFFRRPRGTLSFNVLILIVRGEKRSECYGCLFHGCRLSCAMGPSAQYSQARLLSSQLKALLSGPGRLSCHLTASCAYKSYKSDTLSNLTRRFSQHR